MPPTTTHPHPPHSVPAGRPRRRRPRCPYPARIADASAVLAALATLPTTPAVADLAAALQWPPAKLAAVLDAMERSDLVERWMDPDHRGKVRVMLSARSLLRLGLALAPRGDRWAVG